MGFFSPVMSFLFAYFHSLFAFLKQSFFRLNDKIKTQQRNLSSGLIIQLPEEEEEKEKQSDVFLIEQKIEAFFSFQFRTFEEYIGKVEENLNQMSDYESEDDDFFEVEYANEEDETMIANIANFSRSSFVHVDNYVNMEEADERRLEINSEVENSQRNEENIEDENVENEGKLSDSLKNTHLFSSDDDESLVSESDSDSVTSSVIDLIRDGFSKIDFEVDNSMEFEVGEASSSKEFLTEEDIELEKFNNGYATDENGLNEETLLVGEKDQQTTSSVNLAEAKSIDEQNILNSGEELSSDFEEKNELERQWEHQDLVEQLKMEIKKVKIMGLPTILEESETPKITEDLKPLKIEEKFQSEDTLNELRKFYKSYKERMRKLDILNYQKLHDMGLIEPKNSLESLTRIKLSNPSMTGIVSLDCWSCKGKSVAEPMKMKRLNIDLEIVYVGQICLSWEFLRCEYGKALKLWDTDFLGIHRYNNVARKFNQFQLLINRFLEDEPTQAPRVLRYAKTRCVLGNLLQVPLIREDDLRDKKKDIKDSVTSIKLVEIIEESIRTLWKLIRTDKYTMTNTVLVKACGRSNVELQNPADEVLLEQLRSTLQKKEKRLKELRVSDNCILRKIRKQQNIEDGTTDNVRHFFSQVDLKLVSRVLNMSKISTQQFSWCSHTLNKINVVSGKLYFDSSFHLFP